MKKAFILTTVMVMLGIALGQGQSGEIERLGDHEHEDYTFEAFEKNVRIGFAVVAEGQPEQPLGFVVTAVPEFKLTSRLKKDGEAGIAVVSGAVDILEDNQILVTLEAEASSVNEQGEFEFGVATAVRLRPGRKQEVARMGNRTLVVHAEYVE